MKSREVTVKAEVAVLAHATEDPDKVLEAVKNLLTKPVFERLSFERRDMVGHYKNPIVSLKATMDGEDGAEALRHILSSLRPLDESTLQRDFTKHMDPRGVLHLRFDKQQAYLGKIAMCTKDAVSLRFRLRLRPSSLEELKTLLGL
jgi:RNA binding exosome subunit